MTSKSVPWTLNEENKKAPNIHQKWKNQTGHECISLQSWEFVSIKMSYIVQSSNIHIPSMQIPTNHGNNKL